MKTSAAHDTLEAQADALSQKFADGTLTATDFRAQLADLKAQHASTPDDASLDVAEAQPKAPRRPVTRTAPSTTPKARTR